MTTKPDARPVWLLTAHRSGGTVLARIINCHPGIVIWGEHGGWINKLAELDATVRRFPNLGVPTARRDLDAYIDHDAHSRITFMPWVSPFQPADFREWARSFIQDTFSKHVPDGCRWGFKEIRYHNPDTAHFLAELFPDSQFIILRRDLRRLIVSNVLAPWSIERLTSHEPDLDEAVRDCAYALAVIEHNFQRIAGTLGKRCILLDHAELASSSALDTVNSVFQFLELSLDDAIKTKISEVLSVKGAGATDWALAHGAISRECVEALVPAALAEANQLLDRDGVDLARIKRLGGRGQYSFLVGDHDLMGSHHSSMF